MKSTVTFKAFLKKLIEKFSRDETTTLAASLAFYTALSVAPILILFVAITSKLKFSVTKLVLEKSQETLGTEATVIIKNIIDNSKQQPDFASIASWVSIIFLLLSASLVFGQIQMALNKIFKEKMPCEDQQDGTAILVCLFLKQKVFYAISVLGFIVLLIATVGVSSLIFSYFEYNNVFLVFFISILSSLFIYTSVFTFMYRYLPQQKHAWKFSFYGGVITAAFFVLGTQIISLYLSNSDIGLAFGASGSLLIFLVWVYYSSMIILIGAQVCSLLINFNSKKRLR